MGTTIQDLEHQIEAKIRDVTISEEDWKLGIKLLNKKYEAEAKQRTQIVSSRQRRYQQLQSELDGYFKMRAKEEMTSEEFASKKAAILEEQSRLKEKIDDGLSGQRTWLELAEDFLTTAFCAREMLLSDDLEAKRKAVAKVGWNLLLKNKRVVWTYQKPYDILLKPTYRSDLRRRWDSNPRESCDSHAFQACGMNHYPTPPTFTFTLFHISFVSLKVNCFSTSSTGNHFNSLTSNAVVASPSPTYFIK